MKNTENPVNVLIFDDSTVRGSIAEQIMSNRIVFSLLILFIEYSEAIN